MKVAVKVEVVGDLTWVYYSDGSKSCFYSERAIHYSSPIALTVGHRGKPVMNFDFVFDIAYDGSTIWSAVYDVTTTGIKEEWKAFDMAAEAARTRHAIMQTDRG